MNIELKPCPFCGGEAELRLRFPGDYPFRPYERRWATVLCDRCAAGVTRAGLDGTEEGAAKDAAEAWNTRAERTCRMDCVGYIGTEESHASIYQCSKCNRRYMSANVPDLGEYCSECGAKVVE